MPRFFSPSTGQIYVRAENLPADAQPITNQLRDTLLKRLAFNKAQIDQNAVISTGE